MKFAVLAQLIKWDKIVQNARTESEAVCDTARGEVRV